jgi:hypothetical protein
MLTRKLKSLIIWLIKEQWARSMRYVKASNRKKQHAVVVRRRVRFELTSQGIDIARTSRHVAWLEPLRTCSTGPAGLELRLQVSRVGH